VKRRTLTRLSLCCLVLQLASAVTAAGRVLCLAADGHVAIEVAHAGSCETEAIRHHGAADAGLATECTDHSCIDVPVSQLSWRDESRHDEHPSLPLLLVETPASRRRSGGVAPALAPMRVAGLRCEAVRLRRSIVLLV
jgi:hypothetical protein